MNKPTRSCLAGNASKANAKAKQSKTNRAQDNKAKQSQTPMAGGTAVNGCALGAALVMLAWRRMPGRCQADARQMPGRIKG